MLGLLVMEFNAMEIFYRFEPLQNSCLFLFIYLMMYIIYFFFINGYICNRHNIKRKYKNG